MRNTEIALECLRIANDRDLSVRQIVERAAALYEFATSESKPVKK